MKEFKIQAHIHSLDGKMDEITVLAPQKLFGKLIPHSYIVKYKDITCTAIFNYFSNAYYCDDVYGKVTQWEK
ncbi:MAG: hypothetical protein IKB30_00095 [Clostridia bacterium]|nr:hypothetical protein [Clostridia bacterium]MBR2498900.1 hypothetical protein [Clostridia bacterium]